MLTPGKAYYIVHMYSTCMLYAEYKISIQILLAIYRKCHLAFNHSVANVQ